MMGKGKRMFARLAFGLCLLLGIAAVQPASAQEVNRIAAVVNDEIISTQELIGRVRLAIVFSNIRDSIEELRFYRERLLVAEDVAG